VNKELNDNNFENFLSTLEKIKSENIVIEEKGIKFKNRHPYKVLLRLLKKEFRFDKEKFLLSENNAQKIINYLYDEVFIPHICESWFANDGFNLDCYGIPKDEIIFLIDIFGENSFKKLLKYLDLKRKVDTNDIDKLMHNFLSSEKK
jgi:hypothetical protein